MATSSGKRRGDPGVMKRTEITQTVYSKLLEAYRDAPGRHVEVVDG